MARSKTEKRRLIKFSNYSMCITLPKWVIDQLEWQKGDELTLVTDVKHGKITLYKDADQTPKEPKQKADLSDTSDDSLHPIPKLRW